MDDLPIATLDEIKLPDTPTRMTLTYEAFDGYGIVKNTLVIEGENAEYLPHIENHFKTFLRGAGFFV